MEISHKPGRGRISAGFFVYEDATAIERNDNIFFVCLFHYILQRYYNTLILNAVKETFPA